MINVHGREALVGAWQLLSWENRAADGQVTYPMGTDALGSLFDTAQWPLLGDDLTAGSGWVRRRGTC